MTHQFVENELCFDFDHRWTPVLEWDRHPAYEHGIREIEHGRAMDLVAVYDRWSLYLIEVKDYRHYKRHKPIDPWVELESKVRNTVAGLLGACRFGEHVSACAPFVDALRNRQVQLFIILWYETPSAAKCPEPTATKRRDVGALVAQRRVKNKVKWLNNVPVLSTRSAVEYQDVLRGVVVTSLPLKRRQMADEILLVFKGRKIKVPDADRQRIMRCLDLRALQRWLERAAVVASPEELFSSDQ
jgi:hypothetical protein